MGERARLPRRRREPVRREPAGRELRWEPFEAGTAGRRLRSILRFAHTGEVLGPVGQLVAGLVSLGTAFLVYTGIALALRRLWAWRRRRERVADAEERLAA